MKLTKTAILAVGILISGTAFADTSFTAHGRVIHSTPVYKTIEVECRDHRYHNSHQSYSDYSNSGHYRDKQNSRTYTTSKANKLSHSLKHSKHGEQGFKNKHNNSSHNKDQHRHNNGRRHYTSKRILKGFDVTYRYNGDTFHTFSKHHPGRRISLNIRISPQF